MKKNRKRIVIGLNSSWNIFNFRSGLIKALTLAGYEVIAVAPQDQYSDRIPALGCQYMPLAMDAKSKNPIKELLVFIRFLLLFKTTQPDVFLGFTIKPNIYGSLAARLLGVKFINNIAGLGTSFQSRTVFTRFLELLYRLALSSSSRVFVQNEDDRQLFINRSLVYGALMDRLPGSGVDLKKFTPTSFPRRPQIRFLLIARMFWDKGIGEYVEAARMLKRRALNAQICLLGFLDVQNPAAISNSQMDEWVAEGVVRYLGVSDNVCEEIAQADCIVLPSFYREGTPKTLLEAAAMARPIITADSVGCRDVVDDGVNGFLCRPKSASDLADKMARMISMPRAEREAMGLRGRDKVERDFDERIVIDKYLEVIEAGG